MDRSADRNLLLGILALQNDLVARDQLIQGLQAWTANMDRPLGEILVELGALDQQHHRLLEHLLDVHVQRHGSVQRSMEACELTSSVRAAFRDVADADVQLRQSTSPPVGRRRPLKSTRTYCGWQRKPTDRSILKRSGA